MAGGQRWDVMMVREFQGSQGEPRSFWTKIGAAFTNKDGSIGVQLDAYPMDGKVILQIPMSKEERENRRQGTWQPQQRSGHGNPNQPQRGGFGGGQGRGQPQQQRQGGSQAQRYQQQPPVPDYPQQDQGGDDFPPPDDEPPFG